jgi:hypothetical protein
MTPIYGFPAALELFGAAGAPLSRQAFHTSILPHLVKSGFARKLGGNGHGGTWEFDRQYLQHWGEYVAEVQRRKADGRLPGNYGYSEADMQAFIDGAWNGSP